MTNPLCEYVYDEESDISTYIFHSQNRAAVDEWIEKLDGQYHRDIERDVPEVKILIDLKSNVLPIAYMMQSLRNWSRKRRDRKPAKVALIYEQSILINVVSTLTATLGYSDSIRWYQTTRMEEALAWLSPSERTDEPISPK